NASALTVTGAPIGTYAFMSPEQVRGEEVGPASDVFSLGCVLAFAANGHGPFDAPTIPAIVRRILDEPPRLDGLADPLRELVAACLAKEPAHRPEIAEILRRTGPSPHIRTEPGTIPSPTEPPALPEPLDLPESRKLGLRGGPGRRSILLGGVAAAAVAVPAVVLWPRDKKDPGDQGKAGKAPKKAKPKRPTAGELNGKVPVAGAAYSPDGGTVAASSYRASTDGLSDDRGDSGCIQLWDMATRRLSTLTLGESDFLPNTVAFSPDSKTLASCDGYYEASDSTGRGGIWLWDATTGRTTTLTEEIVFSVAFRPDGKSLASAGKEGLKVWNVATGHASVLDDSAHDWLALSPDGTTLATTGKSASTEIQLWNLA
ncbi:protein kinase domain-containing protein, partial [Streptomyces mirabilis]